MFSDDDRPLAAKSAPNGKNHTNMHKTNGHIKDAEDYEMSEADDQPLVSWLFPPGLNLALILYLFTSQATRKPGKASAPRKRKNVAISDSSSSDDDVPLASSPAKPAKSRKQNGKGGLSQERVADKKPPKKKVKRQSDASEISSEEDMKPPVAKKGGRKARKQSAADDPSDDDKPIAKKIESKGRARAVKDEPSGSEVTKPKKRGKAKKEEEPASPIKGKGKRKEEEDEEVFRWWEQDPNGDGSVKWTTLEHNGVFFPLPYEPLPSHIKMKYNGGPLPSPFSSKFPNF